MSWKQGLEFVLFVCGFAAMLWLCGNDKFWVLGSAAIYAVYIAMGIILREIKGIKDYINIDPGRKLND